MLNDGRKRDSQQSESQIHEDKTVLERGFDWFRSRNAVSVNSLTLELAETLFIIRAMEFQQLIIRSNRYLAASLLESKLIKSEHVEKANARLLGAIQAGNYKQASLLSILTYDLQVLDEASLIDLVIDTHKIGVISLGNLELKNKVTTESSLELCWSTWSLPFDTLDECVCIASCYYLSKPAVDHWEKLLNRPVIWYATSLNSMAMALEKLETQATQPVT